MTKTRTKTFSFKKWLLLYTAFFLVMSLIIWCPFYTDGKSMIWGYDGLYQTYGAMVYFSRYWKEFFSNLFSGNLCLSMVDTSIGTGFDILTTLNYYGFGDPLLWFSLLFPQERMELCYNFLVILRYYLAGLTFGVYCRSMGKRAVPALGGAFVYIFCGFALYAGVRHPYFMNPWIYFPLLCLGVEQILKGKKGYLLAVTAGISACSNFYFFYMLTILAFLYAIIRFISLYHRQWKEKFLRIFLSGCGWYLLGICLGAVILVPDLLAILSSARAGGRAAFANTWFAYPPDFYKQLLAGYLFPVYLADYWCVLVYPSAAFLGLLVLGNRRKEREHLWLGVWFLLLTLLLWIPLGGLAMNGFSYVSHRWFFSYGFCMALLFVLGVEEVEQISKKSLLLYSMFFFVTAWLFFNNKALSGGIDKKIGAGFCAVFLMNVLSRLLLHHKTRTLFPHIMVLGVLCSSFLSSQSLYSNTGMAYTGEFQEAGKAWQNMTGLSEVLTANEMMNNPAFLRISSSSLTAASESSPAFCRMEGDTPQETNWGMISGINGANSYFSLTRREVYDYAYALENPDLKFPSWYNGFGERAALLSLNCVRYFSKMTEGTMTVPYGYVQNSQFQNSSSSGTILYETPYAMPIGYTYDKVLSVQDWESLSALQKQQALMQAAVIDDEVISGLTTNGKINQTETAQTRLTQKSDLIFQDSPLTFTVLSTEGLTWDQENGSLSVGEGGGQITVQYKEPEDSEIYLRICGFDIEESGYEMLHFFVGADGTQEKKIYCTSSTSAWDGKLKNFLVLVNGGASQEDGSQTARIRFPFSGQFRLDRLEMYSLPMDSFVKQSKARKKESLDAALCQNQIKGTIQVSGNRILCVAVPYSGGWTAAVDGQKVPVWKCNGMHLGIFLEEGTHQVVFSYRTPGLTAGTAITLLALLLLAGTLLWKSGPRFPEKPDAAVHSTC